MLVGIDASRVTRAQRTGTENYSLHLLRELLALDTRADYRLYLNTPLDDGLLALRPGTSTRLISLPRLWTQVGLSLEMRRAPPDVLFVPSHVLPLVLPASSVVVIYDVGHRFVPRAHGALDWLYLEWAIRRHVRLATRLITISQSTRRDLVRLYGADPARIDVAYPAADARFTRASAEEVARVRARYGLGTRYVLHLGTIKPRKNLPRLIQGFARSGLAADTQLALGGMTTYGGPAVERAISDARLGGRLVRLGYVPDADLPALYSGAAAVAIVSLYEGFGMPAVEAMACGATVVASDRGSLPEIVGEAGILVDPLDVGSIAAGLRRAVDDTWFGARGLRRAADFSWRAAALKARSSLDSAYSASVDTAARSRSRSVAS